MKCDICQTDNHYRVKCLEKALWGCPECAAKRYVEPIEQSVGIKQTQYFKTLGNVSVARVKEMERRRIVGWKPDGGYYTGRLMENGKINPDKKAEYRP